MSSKQQPRRTARQSGPSQREFLEDVVESGINEELPQPVRNLLSKDFPLANIRRQDRKYFRLLSENIALYVAEQFPPEDSLLQGDLGAALLEEPEYAMRSLNQQTRNEIETLLMTAFARTSRGEGGWQQDKLSENIQTKRVEDGRVEESDGGIIGGLFQ
jgi:hypothetical protein